MQRGASRAAMCMLAALSAGQAFALSTDRNQPMDVKANYLKTDQNKNTNPDVSTTFLKGDVQITQGSIKAHGAEATIYQDNSNKPAKSANDSGGSSKIKRVVIVGKQAHLEQVPGLGLAQRPYSVFFQIVDSVLMASASLICSSEPGLPTTTTVKFSNSSAIAAAMCSGSRSCA